MSVTRSGFLIPSRLRLSQLSAAGFSPSLRRRCLWRARAGHPHAAQPVQIRYRSPGDVERQEMGEQQPAHHAKTQRAARFRAHAKAEGDGKGAHQRRHGRHHDGTEADARGLPALQGVREWNTPAITARVRRVLRVGVAFGQGIVRVLRRRHVN
jgi:hypothetical protein